MTGIDVVRQCDKVAQVILITFARLLVFLVYIMNVYNAAKVIFYIGEYTLLLFHFSVKISKPIFFVFFNIQGTDFF